MKKMLWVSLLGLAAPALVYADSCRYERDIEFTVDAASARNLLVDVGAGSLDIRGDANTSEVVVSARACASSRSRLDDVELRHRTRGDEIEVYTDIDVDGSFLWWWGSGYARIDIEMTVPNGLPLEVDDGSGSVDIHGVAALELEDGSGSISVSNVQGDVYVDDGSGSITIRDVQGLVSVEDGAGGLRITSSNAVHIIDDGSGSIHIENITNNVYVEEDGSGGIDIRNVGGDVSVDDSGSGSVNVSGVAGNSFIDRS